MAFMGTRCSKSSNGNGSFTSILFALFIGAVAGCVFGLLDTVITCVLIEDQRSNVTQRLSRSVLEGSFVGAIFGSVFAGLKLMM